MTGVISISEDELLQSLWDSLDKCEPSLTLRLQTDIGSDQFAEHYGISVNCARTRMRQLASAHGEQWQLVKVLDSGYVRNVLRRKVV